MGIFDDAIREHLELKRHAGADEEELKEMEDEAFGPPARPGDPDFPSSTSEEAAVESDEPEGELEESPTAEAEAAPVQGVFDGETPDDAVIEAPSDEEPALTPIEETTVLETEEEPAALESAEPESAPEPEDAAPAPEPEGPPVENEPVDPADAPTFTTAEREAIADQPTVFFEQQPPADLELGELELDLDEEIEEVGGSVSEPLPEEEQLIVEEAFAEPAEAEVAEPPHEVEPEPDSEEEGEPSPPETSDFPPTEVAETGEEGTSDDDVLEETPEFLRDNPDDDELWFEQGEPKDFDF